MEGKGKERLFFLVRVIAKAQEVLPLGFGIAKERRASGAKRPEVDKDCKMQGLYMQYRNITKGRLKIIHAFRNYHNSFRMWSVKYH